MRRHALTAAITAVAVVLVGASFSYAHGTDPVSVALDSAATAINNRINAVEAKADAVQADANANATAITALDGRADALEADVADLAARVAALEGGSPPPGGSNKLKHSPPGYDGTGDPRDAANYPGYTVIDVSSTGANRGLLDGGLNDSTDYFLRLGDYRASDLRIRGGRNVVMVGGSITNTNPAGSNCSSRTGLKLWPRPGTQSYFIEGISIQAQAGDVLCDGVVVQGIDSEAKDASDRIYLQNLRVGPVGQKSGTGDHADAFQQQSNQPGQILFDRVTMLYDYTCVMLSDFRVGLLDFSRTNCRAADVSTATQAWTGFYQGVREARIVFSDFWVDFAGSGTPWLNHWYPYTQAAGGRTYQSQPEDHAVIATDADGEYASWTATSNIAGQLRNGSPSGGDFVPAGSVGTAYVSPGYVG